MPQYLVFGFYNNPGGITRVNPGNFLRDSYLAFDGASSEWDIQWIARDGIFAYCVCDNTNPGKIIKVNLSTFTKVATLDLLAGERDLFGAAISDGFLYVSSAAEKIIKIRLSDFTRIGVLSVSSIDPSSLHIKDGFLYVCHYSNPAGVAKIDLSTFTIDTETTYAGQASITCGIISGDYLYGGCVKSPARILKILLSDLSLDTALSLNSGENRAESLAIFGTDLDVGLHTEIAETDPPPYVAKVDLTTFTETGSALTNAVHRTMWAAHIIGGFLYLGDYKVPAQIIKVNLKTFAEHSTITMPAGDEDLMSRNFITTVLPSGALSRVTGIRHIYRANALPQDTYNVILVIGGISVYSNYVRRLKLGPLGEWTPPVDIPELPEGMP